MSKQIDYQQNSYEYVQSEWLPGTHGVAFREKLVKYAVSGPDLPRRDGSRVRSLGDVVTAGGGRAQDGGEYNSEV